ncbi:flagellar export chaperone FliS [Aeoliella sp. ICT_H6.2]|uniref:Flagellar export chaperone FliS n=1 Tax=Aeoliella straminimaris TaxID=2954799 RepID=A0A9X2F8G5_9BACT|nr:flagellar export chaperone FliS [Aeoliella straminimaris]MCO6043779.1 flagellar export chaperone FliS [Aeoliella straminimaris]
MPQANPSSYLESKVKTASPAQLHLMLIEGALRFCTKAQHELGDNNEGHANEAMLRAMDIVGEMLAGVRGGESDINQKLCELYQFLFYTLTSAYVNTDATKLSDVMRILEFERETWQLACERAHTQQKGNARPTTSTPIVAPHIAQPTTAAQGLSFEA